MILLLKEIYSALLDLLYPPFCCGCGKFYTYLCPNCYQTINFIPLPLSVSLETNYLESIYVTAHYEGVIKKLIKTYKYKSVKDIGVVLSTLIWYSTALPRVDLISYVPINKKKFSKRGFNQTEIIAKELSLLIKVPCLPILSKVGKYKDQASMETQEDRLNNLKDAFVISPQYKKYIKENNLKNNNIGSKNNKVTSILLIDDVITTGTTLNEAAKVIKECGIKKVYGYAIASGH
ncbi:MAG: ComF family protein [Candidatus Pacebacteria bacterium]|nr:ComF family protein [Candidatus Paceibacterota bacterium]